jgi:chromosome segregation ATPase
VLGKQKQELDVEASELLAKVKADTEQEISAQRVEFNEKIQEYQTMLEQAKTDAEQKISEYRDNFKQVKIRAESEAGATLEAEQKLKTISEKLAGLEQRLIEQIEARNRAEALSKNEQRARAEAEQKIQVEKQARNRLEQELNRSLEQIYKAKEKAEAETTQAKPQLSEPANTVTRMGTCECCGKNNIEETDLVKIVSGQLLCSDCLMALKGSSVS